MSFNLLTFLSSKFDLIISAAGYSSTRVIYFVLRILIVSIIIHTFFFIQIRKWIKVYNFPEKEYKKIIRLILAFIIYFLLVGLIRYYFRIAKVKSPEFLYYLAIYPSTMYMYIVFSYTLFAIVYFPIKYLYKAGVFILEKLKVGFVEKIKFSDRSKKLLTKLAPILPLFILLYGIYGNIRYSYVTEITKPVYKSETLPAGLNNFTVVHVSDIHVGMFMRKRKLDKLVKIINSLNKDVIFMTGDFVDINIAYLKELTDALKKVKKPKYGIFAVLGNHDLYSGYDKIASGLKKAGVRVLQNEHVVLNINNVKLVIGGVEDLSTGRTDINKTFKNVFGDFKILLSHQPYRFEMFAETGVDLMFSGHTHGGQIVPLKIGDVYITPAYLFSKYMRGFYKYKKSMLYVNRGYGIVALPMRVQADAEITQMTFKRLDNGN